MNKPKLVLSSILLTLLLTLVSPLVTYADGKQLLVLVPGPSSEALRITKLARQYVSLHDLQFKLDKNAKTNLSASDLATAKKLLGQSNAVLHKAQVKINAKKWVYKEHPVKKFVSLATYKSPAQFKKMRAQYSFQRNYKIVTPFYVTKSVAIQYNDQKLEQRMKVLSQALKQVKLNGW